MPLEENWSSETKQIWEEVEAIGKEKEWDTIEIHRAFIQKLDEKEGKKKEKNKLINLPVEAKETRAAPNVCLRSALFGVVKPGRRKFLQHTVLASQEGYQVIYNGERLDQSDFDVWLAVKHICAKHPIDRKIQFTAKEIFNILGKPDGGANREWLKRSLTRLHECSVAMKAPNGSEFHSHLVNSWKWEEETYNFVVSLSNDLKPLFEKDSYTLIDIKNRKNLHKDLSKWLVSYWSSHNEIYPIKDTKLQALCGSEASKDRFRRDLRQALKELEKIGFIKAGGKVERNGMVFVEKNCKKLIGFRKKKA